MAVSTHGRGADQVSLRLPDGMRDRIKAAADANGRSMNAEIIATLLEKYPREVPLKELHEELKKFLHNYRDDLKYRGLDQLQRTLEEVGMVLDSLRELERDNQDDPRGY